MIITSLQQLLTTKNDIVILISLNLAIKSILTPKDKTIKCLNLKGVRILSWTDRQCCKCQSIVVTRKGD